MTLAAVTTQNVGSGGAIKVAAALLCMVAYDGETRVRDTRGSACDSTMGTQVRRRILPAASAR